MKDEIFKLMGDKAYQRQEKMTYRIGEFPHYCDLDNRTICGSFSWTTPAENMRYVHPETMVDIGHGTQTEPEIARDYLRVKYKTPPKIKKVQLDELTKPRKAPTMAIPGEYADMTYIDIKSAYWSIIRIIGWDVDYMPGRFITVRSSNEDFPAADHKTARNTLVSSTQSGKLPVWTGRQLIMENIGATMINSALWAAVADILNGVAMDMERLGAVYINTDGYIVPRAKQEQAIDTIRAWGLPSSVKHEGDCKVICVGAYTIGDHTTKQRRRVFPSTSHAIDYRWGDWLRPRVAFLRKFRVDREGANLL